MVVIRGESCYNTSVNGCFEAFEFTKFVSLRCVFVSLIFSIGIFGSYFKYLTFKTVLYVKNLNLKGGMRSIRVIFGVMYLSIIL